MEVDFDYFSFQSLANHSIGKRPGKEFGEDGDDVKNKEGHCAGEERE